MRGRISVVAVVCAFVASNGCGGSPTSGPAPATPVPSTVVTDPHSFANTGFPYVVSVDLDLTADFAAKTLRGRARLKTEGAGEALVLDTRGLTIRSVSASGKPLPFSLGETKGVLGAPLSVAVKGAADLTVDIEYETAPDAAALQWLAPPQTAGKKLPFLFTQGQAILTRTWIPTQDSPGRRQRYTAAIHVPAGMRAVMSAEDVSQPNERDAAGLSVYRYKMDHPIPPYLIALAVGDIAFKPIGTRTGVYAEPSVVARAAAEFVEVDQMIAAAEKLYGAYRWGRYDLLVLPPSFPFGGMENPTLTFATPTVLAGDRSLVSLVAHELAHSWSGNLVTNATWNDFWLNEGFTTYIEQRIMEELRGKPYADMHRQLGRQDLAQGIADAGGPQAADTRLQLDLTGRDPDEGTTNIPYEKGAAFLQTVDSVVGRERLDAWLRAYFDQFAFQPMTSERMVAFMHEKLLRPGEAEKIDINAWIHDPGLPANAPVINGVLFAAVDKQVEAWKGGAAPASLTTKAWSTQEWLHFLQSLPAAIDTSKLAALDKAFGFTRSGNSEILCEWLQIAIRNRYEPAFPAVDGFLTSQGRRKYLRPIYAELVKTDWGTKMARDIYKRARPTYHSVSSGAIDQIVK